jgi:multidrug efflux pump subunit AcrB
MRAFPDLASRAPLKEKFHEGELWNLIGVIVSRVIVLFDFREEQHERGAAEDALIDARIRRVRSVLITVGATDAVTRINIAPTILLKQFEELRQLVR